jgi:hypothetical protein
MHVIEHPERIPKGIYDLQTFWLLPKEKGQFFEPSLCFTVVATSPTPDGLRLSAARDDLLLVVTKNSLQLFFGVESEGKGTDSDENNIVRNYGWCRVMSPDGSY